MTHLSPNPAVQPKDRDARIAAGGDAVIAVVGMPAAEMLAVMAVEDLAVQDGGMVMVAEIVMVVGIATAVAIAVDAVDVGVVALADDVMDPLG